MAFLGPDFPINSTTDGTQAASHQAVLTDGNILVTWQSNENDAPDGTSYPTVIRGRIFDSDGSALGPDFAINTTNQGSESGASVTALPDGDALVTWQSSIPDTTEAHIYGRFVHPDGTSDGPDFLVNPTTGAVGDSGPAVTTLADGDVLVTWTINYNDDPPGAPYGSPNQLDIGGRIYSADGTSLTSEFVVNNSTLSVQDGQVVTALPSGGAFVAWQSFDKDVGAFEIHGRFLNADGSPAAPDFQINSTDVKQGMEPSVATLEDGRVIATWSASDGIQGHILNADGTVSGPDFVVSAGTPYGAESSVTALHDGRALVVWEGSDITSGDGIYARIINADGTLAGLPFLVNSATDLSELHPSATTLPDGDVMISWSTYDPVTFAQDVHGRILSLQGDIVGTPGNDVIHGTAANDTIHGGDGNDVVLAGGGDDTIYGDAGTNLLWGNDGNDTFVGGPGVDSFAGGAGIDTVRYDSTATSGVHVDLTQNVASGGDAAGDTFNSIENLIGTRFNDTLIGNAAGNHLSGGDGNDVLYGQAGDDTLEGGWGDDTLFGGAGNDVLQGGIGHDRMWGNDGNDTFKGDNGMDVIDGGAGIDTVDYSASPGAVIVNLALGTGAGNDAAGDTFVSIESAIGSAFDDELIAGPGTRDLTGGAGADTFTFVTLPTAATSDVSILDFSASQGDHIDLSALDANTGLAGTQAFHFVGSEAFSHTAGELRFADHILEGDIDGNGTADFAIHVNVAALHASDLIL